MTDREILITIIERSCMERNPNMPKKTAYEMLAKLILEAGFVRSNEPTAMMAKEIEKEELKRKEEILS